MSLSDKYDQFYDSSLAKEQLREVQVCGWPRDRMEAIVAMNGTGEKILDVGCGNGLLLYQFRKSFRTLVGLEYSPRRLAQAKINLEGYNFVPVRGSAEDVESIETGSIDRIISADTIEHIPDVYSASAEMFRVLRQNGELVINTPNIAFLKKRLQLLAGRFPSTSQANEGIGSSALFDGGHFHYFTYRSLRIVLEKAGFVPVRRIGYGRFGRIHNLLPSVASVGVQWLMVKP